jgi:hypothetical protein
MGAPTASEPISALSAHNTPSASAASANRSALCALQLVEAVVEADVPDGVDDPAPS